MGRKKKRVQHRVKTWILGFALMGAAFTAAAFYAHPVQAAQASLSLQTTGTIPFDYGTFSPRYSGTCTSTVASILQDPTHSGVHRWNVGETLTCYNVGSYQGVQVDMRLKLIDVGNVNTSNTATPVTEVWNPLDGRIGVQGGYSWQKVQVTFYNHATQKEMVVKGYSTWCDFDNTEFLEAVDNVDWIASYADNSFKYANNRVTSTSNVDQGKNELDDLKHAVMIGFSASSYSFIYGSNSTRGSEMMTTPLLPFTVDANSIYDPFVAVPQMDTLIKNTDGGYVPTPDTVYQNANSMTNAVVESYDKEFAYSLFTSVPPESSWNRYTKFVLTDQVVSGVTVNKSAIRIYTEGFKKNATDKKDIYFDATDLFTIDLSTDNKLTITAKADTLLDKSFYGKTYEIILPVSVKGDQYASLPTVSGDSKTHLLTNTVSIAVDRMINNVNQDTTKRYGNTQYVRLNDVYKVSLTPEIYPLLYGGSSSQQLEISATVNNYNAGKDIMDHMLVNAVKVGGFGDRKPEDIAQVESTGLITAKKSGILRLQASYDDAKSADYAYIVIPGDLDCNGVVSLNDAVQMATILRDDSLAHNFDVVDTDNNSKVIPGEDLANMNNLAGVDVDDIVKVVAMVRGCSDYYN